MVTYAIGVGIEREQTNYGYTFGWSFILGWIGVVFAVISGVFAFVKGRQSNPNTNEMQSLNSSPDAL